jgi:hypothetical protein
MKAGSAAKAAERKKHGLREMIKTNVMKDTWSSRIQTPQEPLTLKYRVAVC